jgi:Mor family transcriptional regulator
MEEKLLNHIRSFSKATYKADRNAVIYELYTTGKKTARELSFEYNLAIKNIHKIVKQYEKKLQQAKGGE